MCFSHTNSTYILPYQGNTILWFCQFRQDHSGLVLFLRSLSDFRRPAVEFICIFSQMFHLFYNYKACVRANGNSQSNTNAISLSSPKFLKKFCFIRLSTQSSLPRLCCSPSKIFSGLRPLQ